MTCFAGARIVRFAIRFCRAPISCSPSRINTGIVPKLSSASVGTLPPSEISVILAYPNPIAAPIGTYSAASIGPSPNSGKIVRLFRSIPFPTLNRGLSSFSFGILPPMAGRNLDSDKIRTILPMSRYGGRFRAMPPRKGEPPKKSYHWGETLPDALIDEAMRLVEPLGHHSLSTREVARAVGVSHAAPKHYFSDKLALVAAVAAAGFERLHQEIVRAVA